MFYLHNLMKPPSFCSISASPFHPTHSIMYNARNDFNKIKE